MRAIPKLTRLAGSIRVPSSRDETLRALLEAAVVPGEVRVVDGLDMDDTRYVLEAIRKLGFDVSGSFRDGIVIGDRIGIYASDVEIDVGDSEPAFRWLLPFLCFTAGRTILRFPRAIDVSAPVESLRAVGAEIEYPQTEGQPPLQIRGKLMRGGTEFSSSDRVTLEAMRTMARTFRDGLWISGSRVETTSNPGTISIHPDPFLLACWRAAVESIGGEIELNGQREVSSGGAQVSVEPRDEAQAAVWLAISGLRSGGVVVEDEALLARSYPRFWKTFDEVVASSS